jgi:hypothetical protein
VGQHVHRAVPVEYAKQGSTQSSPSDAHLASSAAGAGVGVGDATPVDREMRVFMKPGHGLQAAVGEPGRPAKSDSRADAPVPSFAR